MKDKYKEWLDIKDWIKKRKEIKLWNKYLDDLLKTINRR